MIKKIAVLVLVAFTSISQAQVDDYSEDVKKCLKTNGTYEYYENVVDQMFGMLEEQYASQNVPTAVWDDVKSVKKDTMDELGQMLVSAYRGLFSHQDVKNMNKLYTTEAGKNMFKNAPLSEKHKAELSAFYATETGQKIVASQDDMTNAMSKVSEMWSSDLYRSVIDKLSEKGYNL